MVSGSGRWYLRGPNDLNREQTARVHRERERERENNAREKGRRKTSVADRGTKGEG